VTAPPSPAPAPEGRRTAPPAGAEAVPGTASDRSAPPLPEDLS